MFSPVTPCIPNRLNNQPPTTAPTMPRAMSRKNPSPVLLTSLLPMKSAIRPSTTHEMIDMVDLLSWPRARHAFLPSRPQRVPQVTRTQAEGERQHDEAEEDGVASDDPNERQNANARRDDENEAENHRQHAARNQKPLTVGAMKMNRRDDLQHARHNGPGADNERQNHRRGAGEDEGDEAGRDPEDPPPEERAEALVMFCRLHPGHYGQHSVDERVRPEERDQNHEGQPGHDKRGHSEEDCQRTSQRERPPVTDEHDRHRTPPPFRGAVKLTHHGGVRTWTVTRSPDPPPR